MPSPTIETTADAIATNSITRDRNGYWIIGNPNQGCQYCGDVTAVEGREGGKTILYHPSTECCARAVDRQINWRSDELQRINLAWTAEDKHVRELQIEAEQTRGYKAADANKAAEHARRGLNARVAQVWKEQVKELGDDIRRLRGVKAQLLEANP